METQTTDEELVWSEAAGCYWVFGAALILLGGYAAWLELGRAPAGGASDLPQVFALVMAGASALFGLAVIYRSPGTRLTVRRAERILTVRRRGLFPDRAEQIAFSQVRAVKLVERPRRGILPMYGLALRLEDGRELLLTRLWTQDRERLEAEAKRLRAVLGL